MHLSSSDRKRQQCCTANDLKTTVLQSTVRDIRLKQREFKTKQEEEKNPTGFELMTFRTMAPKDATEPTNR